MKRYLNLKTNYGIETIDELDSNDFNNLKEFKAELKRLVNEYEMVGIQAYWSQKQRRKNVFFISFIKYLKQTELIAKGHNANCVAI